MQSVSFHIARVTDAADLLSVYAPYVRETAITFEYDVPTVSEFSGRIRETSRRFPYLVAERDGKIVGYAYAGAFHPRRAYAWCAEISVYLAREARGGGIGKSLVSQLEFLLKRQGFCNAYACVAVPRGDDAFLDANSLDFHTHIGYETIGRFHRCGCKFGHWYDMVWMEKFLQEEEASDAPVSFASPDFAGRLKDVSWKNPAELEFLLP